MTFLSASMNIEGEAFQVIRDAVTFGKGRAIRSVSLTVSVRMAGRMGQQGLREDYFLPAIKNGDATLAIEHAEKLSRQTRITDEESARVFDAIAQFVELTR